MPYPAPTPAPCAIQCPYTFPCALSPTQHPPLSSTLPLPNVPYTTPANPFANPGHYLAHTRTLAPCTLPCSYHCPCALPYTYP